MGQIVGAALVAHHPGMMQPEEARRARGAGNDTDLVAGFARLRSHVDAVRADTFVLFDTHWFTTNMHLVAGAAHYTGLYTSFELPFALSRVKYDFKGAPELAEAVEAVAKERKVTARNVTEPTMPLQYPTINVVARLGRAEKVMPAGVCQNATFAQYMEMGAVIGEAISRAPGRVVLLASGALSHKFTPVDFQLRNPNAWHPDNLSDPKNFEIDQRMIERFKQGRHDQALEHYPDMRAAHYEGWGAHYVQMAAALGGKNWRAKGTPCSAYENASGTGNIHMWFDIEQGRAA